jgi:hypothetical protein
LKNPVAFDLLINDPLAEEITLVRLLKNAPAPGIEPPLPQMEQGLPIRFTILPLSSSANGGKAASQKNKKKREYGTVFLRPKPIGIPVSPL